VLSRVLFRVVLGGTGGGGLRGTRLGYGCATGGIACATLPTAFWAAPIGSNGRYVGKMASKLTLVAKSVWKVAISQTPILTLVAKSRQAPAPENSSC